MAIDLRRTDRASYTAGDDPTIVELPPLPTVTARDLPAGDRVRFALLDEASPAQVLHRGSYADEAPTIARLHRFIADGGWTAAGRHHEIYLSDPRGTAPERRMCTIIRQPVRPA